MGYRTYTGSQSDVVKVELLSTDPPWARVLSEGPTVFDGILVGATESAPTEFQIGITNMDGVDYHVWNLNLQTSVTRRDGLWHGPGGIRCRNGLQIRLLNLDAGNSDVNLTFLYRKGMG